MNIINTLTKKHLKENMSRTIVTILGITISVAMITAVFTTVASFFDFFGRLAIISEGKGEATFREISASTVESLRNDDRIEVVGIRSEDNSQRGYTLSEGATMFTKRGSMYTGDPTHLGQVVFCRYEGELPKCGDEIAVEESLLIENDLDLGIGDLITMDIGRRT